MRSQDVSGDLDLVLPPQQWLGSKVRQRTNASHYGPIAEFDQIVAARARTVAYIRRGDGAGGSGFLVAPDLLLTNHHVLSTPEEAAACTVYFNFVRGLPDAPIAGEAEGFACQPSGSDGLYYASPVRLSGVDSQHLDFALVRLNGRPGDRWGYVPVTRTPWAPLNAALTIIQHPQRRPTFVGQGSGQLKHRSNLVVQYITDTEPGSSGSPCFNEHWELVGVHHARFNFPPGAILEDGAQATAPRLGNEGILITAILEDLARNLPQLTLPAERRDAEGRLSWPAMQ